MRENPDELKELSRGKKLACNVSAASLMLAAGLFLLLCGVGAIPLDVRRVLIAALLFAVGFGLLVSAVIQRNTVALWLSFCFIVPAVTELLVKFTPVGYGRLYPLYIAIPAVSSLFTVLLSREWSTHLPIMLLFGVAASVFALHSSGAVGWNIVIPVLVIYVGAVMLAAALKRKKGDEKDEF